MVLFYFKKSFLRLKSFSFNHFINRPCGRAYARGLRPSVCRLYGMYCGKTVRPRAKVTIDSLWEVAYRKSIGTKMNDLDLCLEVVSRSCQPLRYIRRWISRKPLENRGLVPKDHQ